MRKTDEIVTDLRDIASGHVADGQGKLGDILHEAADRLETLTGRPDGADPRLRKMSVKDLARALHDPVNACVMHSHRVGKRVYWLKIARFIVQLAIEKLEKETVMK